MKAVSILTFFFFAGCVATEPFRTLPQSKHQVTLGLGMQNTSASGSEFSESFPYVSIGYFHGITNKVTFGGNIYPLFLLYKSIGFDIGALVQLLNQNDFEMDLGIKGYLFAGTGAGATFLPAAKLPMSYQLSRGLYLFTSPEIIFGRNNFSSAIFTPSLGFALASASTQIQFEVKWLALGQGKIGDSGASFLWNTTGQNVGIFFGLFIGNTGIREK